MPPLKPPVKSCSKGHPNSADARKCNECSSVFPVLSERELVCTSCGAHKYSVVLGKCSNCPYTFADERVPMITPPFEEMYDQVTTSLKGFAAKIPSATEEAWFNYLIESFLRNYKLWANDPNIAGYLKIFKGGKLFRLIGCVYLHVGYDMPRVIANSFLGDKSGQLDDVGIFIPPTISRAKGARLYLVPTPTFSDLLIKNSTKWSVIGAYSIFGWLPGLESVMRCFGHWVIVLRTTAWMQAEILQSSPIRQSLEAKLLKDMENAAATLKRTYLPPQWMAQLVPPSLAFSIGLGFWPFKNVDRFGGVLMGLIGLVLLATQSLTRFNALNFGRYWILVGLIICVLAFVAYLNHLMWRFTDEFGREVYMSLLRIGAEPRSDVEVTQPM